METKALELVREKESEARSLKLAPAWERAVTILAVIWALFQLYVTAFPSLDAVRLRACHLMFMLVMAFILYPARQQGKNALFVKNGRPAVLDWLSLSAGIFAFGYMSLRYDIIALRGGWFDPADYAVAALGVVVCFEMARRVVRNLAWLAGVFLAYAFVGEFIPGAFGHAGFTWHRVAEHLFWGGQGLLGVGAGVSSTYIFMFILFGSFLNHSGFSALVNELALTLGGRSAGGPAKVAVIASALMGMINGSALANVATTGSITIPLMKRTGYKAEFAGAVEAVASTGGQFAPPVMGAVGFIMAEFLGVPYTKVMLAATIPAFLYYLGLIMAVHFEARKLGLKGLAREHIPDALLVIRTRGHLAVPLIILMAIMFMGYTPLYAAFFAILASVAASWLSPHTRMRPHAIIRALDEGARDAVGVGAACIIIGVVIGMVSLTGLGLTFGYEVLKYVGQNQLYLGGICVMLMSTILGMGVPGVAAYVIVAAVAAPVLIKVGASPLAAHMFCLFYACLSNITPPVAMSSYVAAGIARSNQTITSLIAMRLGLTGFILPFFFLNNPLLLYEYGHSTGLTVWAVFSASCGVTALAAGLEGWLSGPCSKPIRLILLVAGVLTIDPGLRTDLIGFALFLLAVILSLKRRPKTAA
ncbi:MAG: TRAP transporter permease [Deltaproteobacteria bacterium]|jgi:TRAP transporter 4TM/12TM fusion protein|nr:TRAP transporter permease [Deltaproteobacteria bacterium]